MKIALICQSYPPMVSGAALVVQRHAIGMVKAGHQCMVLCASDLSRTYDSRSDGVHVVRLRSLRNPLRDNQRFLLWPNAEITSRLDDFQPDIVHFHDPIVGGLFALRLIKQPEYRSRKILTLHQLPWFVSSTFPLLGDAVEPALWRIGEDLLAYYDEVISPSASIADIVSEYTNYRPTVISNGIDLGQFSAAREVEGEEAHLREKYKIPSPNPIILYVGRIDTDKQVNLLVHVAELVFRSVEAQLLVVGGGKQLARIIRLAKELGIDHLCNFTGFVAHKGDLPGLYRLASVFCTPSVVEIQSSVVLEAAATGLPVVAFHASSMPEFIADGKSGYLVPSGDLKAMADRIVELLENKDQANRMGQEALNIARMHSQERSIEAHISLYQRLISANSIPQAM